MELMIPCVSIFFIAVFIYPPLGEKIFSEQADERERREKRREESRDLERGRERERES